MLEFPRRRSDPQHLEAAVGWLINAQTPTGGFGHSFHLTRGWRAPYPETTGYILNTFLELHRRGWGGDVMPSVRRAAGWLCSIQAADGSFADLEGVPQVFDTGQILGGLVDLIQTPGEASDVVRAAAERAAGWLVSGQEEDGRFVRFSYNKRPHAYYSKVGAALMAAGKALHNERFWDAGRRQVKWTLQQQRAEAWFDHMSFDDRPPLLHTMIYVLEGLLDAEKTDPETRTSTAVIRFAEFLARVAEKRDGTLRSRYNSDLTVAQRSLCLVGLAQWAGVCFRLWDMTRNDLFLREGRNALNRVKKSQSFVSEPALHGGVPGSFPISAEYMRFAFPNWAVKYLIDALLLNPTGFP